jgi:hypothetical protein
MRWFRGLRRWWWFQRYPWLPFEEFRAEHNRVIMDLLAEGRLDPRDDWTFETLCRDAKNGRPAARAYLKTLVGAGQ